MPLIDLGLFLEGDSLSSPKETRNARPTACLPELMCGRANAWIGPEPAILWFLHSQRIIPTPSDSKRHISHPVATHPSQRKCLLFQLSRPQKPFQKSKPPRPPSFSLISTLRSPAGSEDLPFHQGSSGLEGQRRQQILRRLRSLCALHWVGSWRVWVSGKSLVGRGWNGLMSSLGDETSNTCRLAYDLFK